MAGFPGSLLEQRGVRIALMALLFPLPLLGVASAAIAVRTATSRGWRTAAVDSAWATAALMMLATLAGGMSLQLGGGAALGWGLAVLLGQLRRSASLDLAVQGAVLIGVAGAVAFMTWSRDPQAYWMDVLVDLTRRARAAGLDLGTDELLPAAAELMTGMMAASAVTGALGALFLGCWWAGRVDGRSFAGEFEALRMGRVMGALAVGVLAAQFTGARASADDLLLVLGVGFVIQGLAVLHWHGRRREWPRIWPLAVYLPLALVPALAAIELLGLAVLGVVDNVYPLRRMGHKLV